MKKLTAGILVALMVLMGAALATAAELPQALKGVNLSAAQALTPDQAQQVRGTAQPGSLPPGFGSAGRSDSNFLSGIPTGDSMNNFHANSSRVFPFIVE